MTYLQRHQQALALNVCKAEIDTSGVASHVAITDDVLNPGVDTVNEAVGELLDPGGIPLRNNERQRTAQRMRTGWQGSVPLHAGSLQS